MRIEEIIEKFKDEYAKEQEWTFSKHDVPIYILREIAPSRELIIRKITGNCIGTDTIPETYGDYETVRYGYLVNFSRSSLQEGETFEKDGKKYIVLHNLYSRGSAATPSRCSFVAIEK